MMLNNHFSFFLCIGLVTCMSPLYKRAFHEGKLDSIFPESLGAKTARWTYPALRNQFSSDHLDGSSHSSASTGKMTTVKKDALLQHVEDRLRKHVDDLPEPQLQKGLKVYPGSGFKLQRLHPGNLEAEIDHVNVCIYEENGKHIVQVTNARVKGDTILDKHSLTNCVRAVFEAFFDHLHNSLGHLPGPHYDQKQEMAANWLMDILTNHKDSLPVMGIIKPETELKDYKFGPHQLELIQLISEYPSEEEIKPQLPDLAGVLALNYIVTHGMKTSQ